MLSNRRSDTRASPRFISSQMRRMSHCSDPFCRTGSLAKRQTSSSSSAPSRKRPSIARPLCAPRSKARYSRIATLQLFQPDVAELGLHRLADVQLEAEQAAELPVLGVVVDDDARDRAVEDLHDRVAAGDDVDLVPVVDLDQRLELVGALLQVADDDRLAALGYVDRLAAHGEETAAALLINLTSPLVGEVDVGLIALHHPLADLGPGRQLNAAQLDAAVGGVHPELDFQLEILRLAAAPDDERVLLDRIGGGALTDDGAVLGLPERRIAVPVLERRAVENRGEAGVITDHQRVGAAGHAAAAAAAAPVLSRRAGG